MHLVLVFRRRIFGYRFECKEGESVYESDNIRNRLDPYLSENNIRKKCFVSKYENYGRILKGFIGFFEEDISVFHGDLEEVVIETGKYLKFGNSRIVDDFGKQQCFDEKIQNYLCENNIRTDWMRFSSGRNSYLRVIN